MGSFCQDSLGYILGSSNRYDNSGCTQMEFKFSQILRGKWQLLLNVYSYCYFIYFHLRYSGFLCVLVYMVQLLRNKHSLYNDSSCGHGWILPVELAEVKKGWISIYCEYSFCIHIVFRMECYGI
jgi:hypothetical protein